MQLQPGQTAQETKYCVLRDHFDQGPPETEHSVGGSVTVQRILTDLPARTRHNRDIIYVKCSPPGDNGSHSQWHRAMHAAVSRLKQKYANCAMFFILAVGMEWLPFYWDPHSRPASAGRALRMMAEGAAGESGGEAGSGWYVVCSEVRAPLGVDAEHVDAEGVVRTDRARSLDCFTVASREAGEAPGLACQEDLDFLEEFIGVVERHGYVGESDPDAE